MDKKIVTIQKNGTNTNSEKLPVPESHFDILEYASNKYNIQATRIFIADGTEVHDASFLRNHDKIYVSEGDDFRPPPAERSELNIDSFSEWITLNIGGKIFTTSRSTLITKEPESMLARMFAGNKSGYRFTPSNIDKNGAYLIDRSPEYFEPILNYLRNGQLVYDRHVNPEGILIEAQFFGIESIIPALQELVSVKNQNTDNQALTRREVIDALIRSAYTTELRFQGVNLAGADLSKLDLRYINFKYANLQGCKLTGANLSYCCLERADLSHAILDGAHLLGVKCLCANLEGVSMQNSNFKDPSGVRANMEGVNLKGANLEGSDLGGVNLRVATLKNANLKNCDLRAAVLAGADLEYCDLSGSDLHEANLRGANLKFAVFELMLTPLHMSQTIR